MRRLRHGAAAGAGARRTRDAGAAAGMGGAAMIRVSDHALLRYLERYVGLDIEAVRIDLESAFARAHGASMSLGVADYAIRSDGHTFIVRDGTVTTVIPDDWLGPGALFHALAPLPRRDY
jgi:hypothetical protein